MKKYLILYLLLAILPVNILLASSKKEKYKNPSVPIEERISDLMSRMTLKEKVLQLNQYTIGLNDNNNNIGGATGTIPLEIGSLIYFSSTPEIRNTIQKKVMEQSRLAIPILFGYDVIHGFRNIYPIPLASACSWNIELFRKATKVAASEARKSGVDWTFSPMIDVSRDGRWGRIAECFGEDPYVNSVFAEAAVKGYQGDTLSNKESIAACLKHYVGYGASEAGRDYVYTEISLNSLWNTYLPPYEAGVKAGAATVMSAFNSINGTPATSNRYTLTDVLKKMWNFKGFVVSDWNAVPQLMDQGVAANRKEAACKAFTAGVEMDMLGNCYRDFFEELLSEGKITNEEIDDAVRRVLRVKFELGLFENPYTPKYADSKRILLSNGKNISKQLAEESMVLLKNKNNVLPLNASKKVALIGPMADDTRNQLGSWCAHGDMNDVVSIYKGIKEFMTSDNIVYSKGCDFDGNNQSGFADAINKANSADVVVLCLGELAAWSGENAPRSTLALPVIQENLLNELSKTGKPIVLLVSSGRPIELAKMEPKCSSIIEIWQTGIMAGNAVAGILFGKVNPSGRLAVTFPYSTNQIPIYYDRYRSGRPTIGKYLDITNEPLYEFGYGLSYSQYEYDKIKASSVNVNHKDKYKLELSINVTNSGNMDGKETVMWFVTAKSSSVSRPVREMKYFEKRLIKAGETENFKWNVKLLDEMGYYKEDGTKVLEPGVYTVQVKDNKIDINIE